MGLYRKARYFQGFPSSFMEQPPPFNPPENLHHTGKTAQIVGKCSQSAVKCSRENRQGRPSPFVFQPCPLILNGRFALSGPYFIRAGQKVDFDVSPSQWPGRHRPFKSHRHSQSILFPISLESSATPFDYPSKPPDQQNPEAFLPGVALASRATR